MPGKKVQVNRFGGGDGPVGAGGDHLPEGGVADIPRGEDAGDGCLHKLIGDDEAALVEGHLVLNEVRPWEDPHGHEEAADGQLPGLMGELIFHGDGR